MNSGEHFLLSVPVVGSVLAVVERPEPRRSAALAAYGLGVGVLVDLDHFVLARLRAGDWRHLGACLRDPVRVVTDQETLFAGMELARCRLLSHVVLAGAMTALARRVHRPAGLLTAAVLSTHVLADLLRDEGVV